MSKQATGSGSLWLFGSVIFTSAFLIFQVQPLIGRFVLPWFGGTPGVWTTCMLFFQTVLFAGYAYAHLTIRYLSPRSQFLLHGALLIAATLLLPIEPNPAFKPTDAVAPVWRILGLLSVSVGLPYFILSSTGPLLQAWFSRANSGKSPYGLYSLSNVGSLLGLITYPFVFEPRLSLSSQSSLWSVAFGLFSLMCAVCAYLAIGSGNRDAAGAEGRTLVSGGGGKPNTPVSLAASPAAGSPAGAGPAVVQTGAASVADNSTTATAGQTPEVVPTVFLRGMWFLLSMCGSVLLLASTNQVCIDVAVIPFLWVLPLTLYLLSFILVFGPRWCYPRVLLLLAIPFCIAAITLVSVTLEDTPFIKMIASAVSGDRIKIGFGDEAKADEWKFPAWMSVSPDSIGRATGLDGSDTSITGQILAHFIGLFVFCMVCHGEMVRLRPGARYLTEFFLLTSAGGAAGGIFVGVVAPSVFDRYVELPLGLLVSSIVILFSVASDSTLWINRRGFGRYCWVIIAIGMVLLARQSVEQMNESSVYDVARIRNFYGMLFVTQGVDTDPEYNSLKLVHGRILHGQQFVAEDRRRIPTTYYARRSGLGLALQVIAERGGPKTIGMVGLGVGTFAAYGEAGDNVLFYEINPAVEELARKHFFYLNECPTPPKVLLGDARLTLERQESQQFDLLALDAFSSDAIPVHLLTREAFDIYNRHMKPNGVIAVHISNRHFYLHPLVYGAAEHLGMKAIAVKAEFSREERREQLTNRSTWMLMSRDSALLESEVFDGTADNEAPDVPPLLWTDDYSNVVDVLRVVIDRRAELAAEAAEAATKPAEAENKATSVDAKPAENVAPE